MKSALIRFFLIILVSILSGYLVYLGLQKKQSIHLNFNILKATAKVVENKDITSVLQNLTAPSLGIYGVSLLTDGIEADVNAWHAPQKPQYPVAIDVTFKKNVLIRQIGIQSQYGGPGNLARAPKMVKVYGGADASHLEELGVLTFEFQAAGVWTLRDILAKAKNKYLYYRLEILSNQGSPDFLTIQELKFYGEA